MEQLKPYRKSWESMTPDQIKAQIRIRSLNDKLRKTIPRTQDLVIVMGDLRGEEPETQMAVYRAARDFNAFTEANDPYGEHDCASFDLEIDGRQETFMFKIDYYDLDLKWHSVDPADPAVTRRVMTLMYARDR